MFLSVIAAAAAISSSYAPPAAQATPVERAVAVMVDCQVSGPSLTDCKAVDAQGAQAQEAVELALQVEVPEAFALANPGRILIRMNVAQ